MARIPRQDVGGWHQLPLCCDGREKEGRGGGGGAHRMRVAARRRLLRFWREIAATAAECERRRAEAETRRLFRLCQAAVRGWRLVAAQAALEARREDEAFWHWAGGLQVRGPSCPPRRLAPLPFAAACYHASAPHSDGRGP